jgi:hypothetical protein
VDAARVAAATRLDSEQTKALIDVAFARTACACLRFVKRSTKKGGVSA